MHPGVDGCTREKQQREIIHAAESIHLTMTMSDMSVNADNSIRLSDLESVNTRLRSLLARVASGEVCASPGFEQRLFGCLVAFELLASGQAVNLRSLLEQLV